jgi:ribosomal protein S6--L-glutamate ligase
MKIAILSRKSSLYSTAQLVWAAEQRGHLVEVIDPLKCYMSISSAEPKVFYNGRDLSDFDAVIPRIGASITFYGTAVVRQFEMMGVYCVNESVAISRSRDKLRSLQIMSREGIGLPVSCFAHSTHSTQELIDTVGGTPLIVKLLIGTQGKGVVLAESRRAAESVIDAFRGLDAHFLVQEYIEEAAGADLRCFVIGDKIVGTMKRQAKEGEFRSNLHCGGVATLVEISEAERQTALGAAKAMGLNIAGVDLLRSNRGPLVMEVNSTPGLEGITKSTQVNVAEKIIEFIEQNAQRGKTATLGKG